MDYTSLSDVELLGHIAGPGVAAKLYHGELRALFIPTTQHAFARSRLWAARELIRRLLLEDLKRGLTLASPSATRDYLQLNFVGMEHEVFATLFLDAQNRLIAVEELFRGTLTQTSVYPREVVKRALAHNAAAVMFAHNHPSGIAEPSRADELLTQTLKQALALVEIKVLDHFVVAGKVVVSFAERGLL